MTGCRRQMEYPQDDRLQEADVQDDRLQEADGVAPSG